MPSRTQLFQLLPWTGGLNSSIDESQISPNQLTVADNVLFGTRSTRRRRDGINHNWDNATDGSETIIGEHDFWYYDGSVMQHRIVGVASSGKVYSYSNGVRTELTLDGAATAWSGTLSTCSMQTYNNLLVIAVDGATNVIRKWDPKNDANVIKDLDGTPPKASILGTHQGRLLCNDKSKRDRVHFSPPNDHTQWNGAGDSGAMDVAIGDGDPQGVSALFPTFKGELFIAKRTKLYRVSGLIPDDYIRIKVSDGIGAISHNSVTPVGQDDIMWVSEKGVHSLQAVQAYGDFTSADVSTDIQKTFNDDIDRGRLNRVWGAYLESINSVAFTFTEKSNLNRSLTTNQVSNAVYLYNIPNKAWYRWADLPCSSMIVATDTDRRRFYFGTHTGRISKAFNGTKWDVTSAGAQRAIRMKLETGLIFVGGNPYLNNGFKRFVLHYRPKGTHTLSVNIKIDNQRLTLENSLGFSESSGGTPLGTGFVLGSTVLGTSVVLGAYSRSIDGFGKGIKLIMEQNDMGEEVEIQGFALEFEPAGTAPEVFTR